MHADALAQRFGSDAPPQFVCPAVGLPRRGRLRIADHDEVLLRRNSPVEQPKRLHQHIEQTFYTHDSEPRDASAGRLDVGRPLGQLDGLVVPHLVET